MKAEAFESVRDLGGGFSQFSAKVFVSHPGDVEFTSEDCFKEGLILWMEEVIAFVRTSVHAEGFRDFVQGLDGDCGVLYL